MAIYLDGKRIGNIIKPEPSEKPKWVRPADIEWARNVCINDVQEGKTAKILYLIGDDLPTTQIYIPTNGAIKTSDGAYYTANATHTWDDTNAYTPQTFTEYKKLRWFIVYANYDIPLASQPSVVIYKVFKDFGNLNQTSHFPNIAPYSLQYLDLINSQLYCTTKITSYSNTIFYNRVGLKAIDVTINPASYTEYLLYFNNLTLDNIRVTLIGDKPFASNTFNAGLTATYKNYEYNGQGIVNAQYLAKGYSGKKLPILNFDTSKVTSMERMFVSAANLEKFDKEFNTDNVTNFNSMFDACYNIKTIKLNTPKATDVGSIANACLNLETLELSDLINVTNASNFIANCQSLVNLKLKNIKISLTIGGTYYSRIYGHLLSKESLINVIKELWDYSSGTTAYTLTMSDVNTAKLTNVYVKLITPTEEQIAQDPNLPYKMPCEVCESTDEGAMLIRDYATLKGWTTA